MKKITNLICFTIALLLLLTGCQTNEAKSTQFVEQKLGNITYEIPEGFIDSSTFNAIKNDNLGGMDEKTHEYFFETDILDMLNASLPNLQLEEKTTYGTYEVYKYHTTRIVSGEQTPIDLVAFESGETVYFFTFIWEKDYADQRNEIYAHFLNSLK